jgi:hypothetical protein
MDFLHFVGDGMIPEPIKLWLYVPLYKTEYIEINGWSAIHFFTGLFVAIFLPAVTLLQWFLIHTLWEIYQVAIGMSKVFPDKENKDEWIKEIIDVIFDTIFSVLGFALIKLLQTKTSKSAVFF